MAQRKLHIIEKIILIYGFSVHFAALALLIGAFIQNFFPLNSWNLSIEGFAKITSSAKDIFTTVGLIIGGIWAYYKFIRQRILIPRLEPMPSGRIVSIDGKPYLIATLQLKNVGLSKIDIQQRGSGLDIYLYVPKFIPSSDIDKPYSVPWLAPWSFDAFKDHNWIEPGETLREEQMIELPSHEKFAIMLKIVINTDGKSITGISILEHTGQKTEQQNSDGEEMHGSRI